MVDLDFVYRTFSVASGRFPPQGMGLSVDVYSPDLFELVSSSGSEDSGQAISKSLRPRRLHWRRFDRPAGDVAGLPWGRILDHAAGFQASPFFQQDVGEMVTQLNSIQSLWLNHECAMKQMAGYSFGTYVPPLYTPLSAEVVAEISPRFRRRWIGRVDGQMDFAALSVGDAAAHLFCGRHDTLSLIFSGSSQRVPAVSCWISDISGRSIAIPNPVDGRLLTNSWEFLDEFPLERVVDSMWRGWPAMNGS